MDDDVAGIIYEALPAGWSATIQGVAAQVEFESNG